MKTHEVDFNENSIGEMVAQDYRKAEVFKKFGIDFCCGGKDTLAKTCARKGVDAEEVRLALQELELVPDQHPEDFDSWDLDVLIDYIIDTHHSYVSAALPLLDEFSAKVARVHGDYHPEVVEIANHYQAVANELRQHMQKEENILFPYIKEMVLAKRDNQPFPQCPFGTVRNPINMMEMEHESAGGSMQAISELSSGYNPPAEACNTYRVLYAKLQEFENDLHQHIHLENNILFPKAIALEAEHQ
jgi:regulator of cell morphogenesis and NO signaling